MSRFDYYNRNPLGLEEEDCVTRAISLCSGYSYYDIRHKLELTAELLDCQALCPCCYFHLLDFVFKFPRVEVSGISVGEFAEQNQRGIYLVRMDGHISTIWDGRIKDLFDCSREIITDAWYCGEVEDY